MSIKKHVNMLLCLKKNMLICYYVYKITLSLIVIMSKMFFCLKKY